MTSLPFLLNGTFSGHEFSAAVTGCHTTAKSRRASVGPAHGSQPGAQAGRHAHKGREDVGKDGRNCPSTSVSILRNCAAFPPRNGSLTCRIVEMALFGTNWHFLGGCQFQNVKSENELGRIKNWAGTLSDAACEKGSRQLAFLGAYTEVCAHPGGCGVSNSVSARNNGRLTTDQIVASPWRLDGKLCAHPTYSNYNIRRFTDFVNASRCRWLTGRRSDHFSRTGLN